VDIPGFLRRHPPFDDLTDEELSEVVRATRIEFFPQGQVILVQGGEPSRFLYVVRTGSVEVLDGDHVVDLHQEGEVFGYVSLLTGEEPALTVRAHEEAICYLIEPEVAERMLSTRHGVSFMSRIVRRREIRVLESAGITTTKVDPWAAPVRSLAAREPVTIEPNAKISDAAELMTREHVTSLLIPVDGGWAIVTDRDLRSRVLAEGLGFDTAISDVASSPILSVAEAATVGEVLALMLERGIHHVPVTDGSGRVSRIVTDTELMALERRSAFQLRREVESSSTSGSASRHAREAPMMIADLVDASVDPLEIAHIAAVTNDTLTRRLLELGIEALGEPPCSWSWLALGSEARHEQGIATDQDHALAYAPDGMRPAEADAYFARLAAFVTDGLAEAGIPRCRAGVIAANREWRGSVEEWQDRFRGWVVSPGQTGSAFTGIAFDYRSVAGSLDIRRELDPIIRWAGGQEEFIRHLSRHAIDQRPPKGFLKDAVVEARGTSSVTMDVKHGGIAPITNLARVHAVRAGVMDNRTPRRIRGVVVAGAISEEMGEALEESFHLLWQIRLEHQAKRVRSGAPPDDEVDARDLGPLTRQALKEAFRTIDRTQELLALELGMRR
jgi:CBS domain-containing protein